MTFGDGIDWAVEARRAAAEDAAGGNETVHECAADLVDQLAREGLPRGARLIDCGCNVGRYCAPMRAAGYEYVGVDQSPEALDIAERLNPGAEFLCSFLWHMTFVQRFDVAISIAVLQHNKADEKRRILSCIASALKPGGLFAMRESTVVEATATQLRHQEWIDLVEGHGFKFIRAWHPNAEYGLCDAYLFRRAS